MRMRFLFGRKGWMPVAVAVLTTAILSSPVSAQTLTTLVSFNGTNGRYPQYGSLIADANGNLFGTTPQGGTSDNGTVFEIVKTSTGYASTPIVLFHFDGPVFGHFPNGGLLADADGNLFGTASGGGAFGGGTAFVIRKDSTTPTGYASTPIVLANFDDATGKWPTGGLVADAAGNLFGTTAWAGANGYFGTVFKIAKTSTGYAPLQVLADFDSSTGQYSDARLFIDANGNLFGTTEFGGGYGTVFQIEKTSTGYNPNPVVLLWGGNPVGSLIADANGNLFGTQSYGGEFDAGTVFEIPKTATGYGAPIVLTNFDGEHGASPYGTLIADANGNLFGTTTVGGASGVGTVFELTKTSTGYASTPIVLASFDVSSSGGRVPWAGLIADANGNLFGTTQIGGEFQAGTVFQLAGSGFVPPFWFAGTRGKPNCSGTSTSTLAQTYGGMARAAAALGYASVKDLQYAIGAYCGS